MSSGKRSKRARKTLFVDDEADESDGQGGTRSQDDDDDDDPSQRAEDEAFIDDGSQDASDSMFHHGALAHEDFDAEAQDVQKIVRDLEQRAAQHRHDSDDLPTGLAFFKVSSSSSSSSSMMPVMADRAEVAPDPPVFEDVASRPLFGQEDEDEFEASQRFAERQPGGAGSVKELRESVSIINNANALKEKSSLLQAMAILKEQAVRQVQNQMPLVYLKGPMENERVFEKPSKSIDSLSLFPRHLSTMNADQLISSAEHLWSLFSVHGKPEATADVQMLMDTFFPREMDTPIDVIHSIGTFYKMQYLYLFMFLSSTKDVRFDANKDLQKKMCVVVDRINLLIDTRIAYARLHATFSPAYGPEFSVYSHIMHNELVHADLSDYQAALYYVLNRCHAEGLRRSKDHLFKPRLVSGVFSRAYVKHKSCQEFVNELLEHCATTSAFNKLTRNSNILPNIVKFLETGSCVALPLLKTDSLWVSATNGCYSLEEDRLFSFENVPDGVVCGKIFNVDIMMYEHLRGDFATGTWFDIPNTGLTEIFNKQWRSSSDPNCPPECRVQDVELVKRFNWAMMGRCLYQLGYLDWWHKHYVVIGDPGTGKSIIADSMEAMFQADDVMTLSNIRELMFGLSGLTNKHLWIMREMNRNVNWEEGEWCSVTGGERVEVKKKFVDSYAVTMTTPGMTFGNEMGFRRKRKTGIPRRLFLGHFNYMLPEEEKQDEIREHVLSQTALNLVKINRAYLALLRHFKQHKVKNFDHVMPQYYKDQRDNYVAEVYPMEGFLNSKYVYKGSLEDVWVPEQALKDQYFKYCADKGIAKPPWEEGDFRMAFKNHKIVRTNEMANRRYPRNPECYNGFQEEIRDFFIHGVDVNIDTNFSELHAYRPGENMLEKIARGMAERKQASLGTINGMFPPARRT